MYDGGESLGIRRFLGKINDVANLGKWSNDEKVTILKLKLTGIAEEFFLSDPTHSQLTEYNDIARILIGRFEKAVPLSTRLQLFSSCIQGPSESVQEFAARINKLGTQIFQSGNSAQNTAVRNANDQLLQSRFISGLKNEIRRFVLSRDPLNLEESINAALIEEQNMKLNQIASEERSGLSSAQTENPVLSALADRLQEINLRVGRLQEASAVTARKSGGNYSNRRENVFKCFYCGIQGHRQAECRKRQRDERAARYQPPRRNAASEYSSSSSPRPGGRHVHFRESTPRQLRSPQAFGRKFKVFTDHKPLAGFLSNKNPSSKILRWKLALEEFNYDIHYIRGSLNSVADHLSRYINNITIALPDSKDLINMQREDSVLSTIIQKIDQNDVSPQISNYFINGEESWVFKKRHISSYSAHVNGRVEKPNQSLANILASISQNTNDWDDQLPHTMLALNSAIHEATYTSPFFLEHGRDIRLSYTYEKNSDTPLNRPKFEGPYRVIERFSNVNYRVQHVEQLRKRFNTHVNRMIPFIKRFSYLHLKNLDDLQPDETEVKGIVPSPRYNLRARAGHSAR
ncbi:integrase catalytic domain-containing protein [Trichonephila clavipes]|nr:integrase catalytic domain-containing protein [Trichonephila clavipes]